ncbi:hypothetical protein IWW34DRAFT_354008 [Fusarium oxysporum f. sp. albedinis]|uniref:DUF202 domain-containing protein n=3 Tax=Fusarium oxysporum TaxID=5507 RepID=X0LDS4_FUSOX|nr:hypothetical protein FOVG_03897 [Fusarium oxysporum f. sp. pisi HDV247]EXL71670.1 hypothetical protein FOPG_12631 [Fusarium oxysporum f. sp. conglutinans race 2 54008]EXM23953.1 hypothetical protein FOTG_08900 [Fusarium oxysporum f. sp. vasinfectum 25433]KAG6987515.1 hypothetical protein FocnCong_v003570 [Fusarium oxysporum f. sp. conglutinans]KAI3581932.1 hypothetical protein IWW34DRAFT_354008 [Fusarium oxysporum f. sp. albedinis]KAJ4102441.1 hypothetical protein NW769_010059 [Fusarium oxy
MLRSRSNSEYSLQDLSNRPPSRRPSQTSDGNNSDTRPRNSNTSARGDVSAAPQKEEEKKKRSRLGRFWREYVSCEVDFSASRDHLANERTFLGYLRTSVAMSMVGTLVAQLFSLQHEGQHQAFGYFVTGKPLAMTCYSFSIGTIILGAVRTWRHQRTMMSGKALVGGFELHLLGLCSMLLLLVFFSFLLTIDVVKDKEPEPTATP